MGGRTTVIRRDTIEGYTLRLEMGITSHRFSIYEDVSSYRNSRDLDQVLGFSFIIK
jgi:hypothetical protein